MSRKHNQAAIVNDVSTSKPKVVRPQQPSPDTLAVTHVHSPSPDLAGVSTGCERTGSEQRIISPTVTRSSSRLDTVATTIGALTAQANRGWNTLRAASSGAAAGQHASPDLTAAARRDGAISPVYDAFENAGDLDAGAAGSEQPTCATDRVEWTHWDRMRFADRLSAVLLNVFASGILQVLQADGDDMREALTIASSAFQDRSSRYASPPPRILAARCHPSARAELVLVVDAPLEALTYSLETHSVVHRTRLHGPAGSFMAVGTDGCQLQCNERYISVTLSSPGSIHVLRSDDLSYSTDVITDVASSPHSASAAPCSLSGRFLAYATTKSSPMSEVVADTRRSGHGAGLGTSSGLYGASTGVSGGHGSHESGRTRSNTQGQMFLGVGDVREQVLETSAQVGDVARRVSGNVISGMRTLGEWGSSYLAGAALSPPHTAQGSTPSQSPSQPPASMLSRSAPISSHFSQRSSSSVSNSPRLGPVYDGARSKRSSMHADRESDQPANTSTAIKIVDLGSGRTISTFAPSYQPVAHVALSPNGQLCFTADSLGHAFHVFELQVAGQFGAGRDGREAQSPLLHRYKLLRGVTSAEVVSAQWSADSQWLAVGTRTGAVHLYALNPYGGPASIRNHVSSKIHNATRIPPLSISISSIARTARPTLPSDEAAKPDLPGHLPHSANSSTEVGEQFGVDPVAALPSAAAPAFLMQIAGRSSDESLFAARSSVAGSCDINVLTFDPRSVTISLHKVEVTSSHPGMTKYQATTSSGERPKTAGSRHAAGSSPAATPGSLPSSAGSNTSGLTQMMLRAGGGLLSGTGSSPRLYGDCQRIASWSGLAPISKPKPGDLPMIVAERPTHLLRKPSTRGASIAKAEIETYSQSVRVLPGAIYLSRQCFFRIFDDSERLREAAEFALHRRPTSSLAVREVASMVNAAGSGELYTDRLAGAFDQLDLDDVRFNARSPTSQIPSFPQGHRAKTSGWASRSIPIRTVAGGIGGGIYRAGRELSRGVEMARRRTSGTAASPAGPTGTSKPSQLEQHTALSFDEDEGDVDMFSDLRSRHGPGSATSITSHIDRRGSRSGLASQSSSAETPPTDFSLGSRPGAKTMDRAGGFHDAGPRLIDDSSDDDATMGWDAVADAAVVGREGKQVGSYGETARNDGPGNLAADDFMMGEFDDDDELGGGALYSSGGRGRGSAATTNARPPSPGSDMTASPKALVYSLRGGSSAATGGAMSSGRSSLRATVVLEQPHAALVKRSDSPAPSTRSEAQSSETEFASSGSGSGSGGEAVEAEVEGGKETHTSTTLSSQPLTVAGGMPADGPAAATAAGAVGAGAVAKPVTISTSGGKKKKKGKR